MTWKAYPKLVHLIPKSEMTIKAYPKLVHLIFLCDQSRSRYSIFPHCSFCGLCPLSYSLHLLLKSGPSPHTRLQFGPSWEWMEGRRGGRRRRRRRRRDGEKERREMKNERKQQIKEKMTEQRTMVRSCHWSAQLNSEQDSTNNTNDPILNTCQFEAGTIQSDKNCRQITKIGIKTDPSLALSLILNSPGIISIVI